MASFVSPEGDVPTINIRRRKFCDVGGGKADWAVKRTNVSPTSNQISTSLHPGTHKNTHPFFFLFSLFQHKLLSLLSVMFFCLYKLNIICVCCSFLGVPPGRGSCPLTGPLPFDLIYTDYHGLQQMKQHMGLSLKKHKLVDAHCVCVCGC